MKPFVIVTDSCSDLSAEKRKKYDISYIEMSFRFDGKEYPADLDWKQIPFEHFLRFNEKRHHNKNGASKRSSIRRSV